jgi:hypothetical protein
MEVLIVSRTRMKNGVCCGGINLETGEMIRLHDHWGRNLTLDTPFQIGQVYSLIYRKALHARPIPHIEDKEIMPGYELLRELPTSEFIAEIDRLINVPRGGIESIFEGKLRHSSYSTYISPENIPSFSVCFWRPNANLVKSEFLGKTRYWFGNNVISYVGFQEPLNVITEGTLLRMSLANWWSPDDITEKRCYLQLSGWFNV